MNLKNKARELLGKYGILPTKSLGQNFLADKEVIDLMIKKALITKQDKILEIGPGLGFLTKPLLEYAQKIVGVEIDKKLVKILVERFQDYPNFEIIEKDILKFNPEQSASFKGGEYKIISSLPYQITNRIFRKLTQEWPKPSLAVLIIQKEVAQRVVALPSDSSRGILSIAVQAFFEVEYLKTISPECFYPSPKVDSAIVKLKFKTSPIISSLDAEERERFFKIVKAGFNQRRKKVINPLSSMLKVDKSKVKQVFDKAQIDENSRAQDLSIKDWLKICQEV